MKTEKEVSERSVITRDYLRKIKSKLTELGLDFRPDRAMSSDQGPDAAMSALPPGGINLNSANMGMTIAKDANGGVKVNFDPAMIARIKAQGIFSAEPVIINITPMTPLEIRPLLGLGPVREEEDKLAKV